MKTTSARLIEAYQEQLIALEELRGRMPQLSTIAQLNALDAELHDAETYIKLPENLEGFLARLADTADTVGHPRAPTRQTPHRRSPTAPRGPPGKTSPRSVVSDRCARPSGSLRSYNQLIQLTATDSS